MFPIFTNFSETPCMNVGLDVKISLIRVLSTGGGTGGKLPPPKKISLKKYKKIFQILIFLTTI